MAVATGAAAGARVSGWLTDRSLNSAATSNEETGLTNQNATMMKRTRLARGAKIECRGTAGELRDCRLGWGTYTGRCGVGGGEEDATGLKNLITKVVNGRTSRLAATIGSGGTKQQCRSPPPPCATAVQPLEETSVQLVDAPLRKAKVLHGRDSLITFGLPKGSLQKATADLFMRAGYNIKIHDRNYLPDVDDHELDVVLFRGQEISRYVEDGVLDAGICGYDWIVENESDVVEVCELLYSKATPRPVRWVLAVPETSDVTSIHELAGGIVATELVKTTERYFKKNGVAVQKVEYSWGATEVKARLPGVQAIVDITETGSSLRANKLRILDTILSSTTRLIANRDAWNDPQRRRKIEDIAALLTGAVAGRGKVGLKMNVERHLLPEIIKLLPAEHSPTISTLLDASYCAVEVVCTVGDARELLPQVKRLGAKGIFTYALDVLIP